MTPGRKTHTKMRAGLLVAVYVQDGQGRRIVVAREKDGLLQGTMVLASSRSEVHHAITTLMQLAEELPDDREAIALPERWESP